MELSELEALALGTDRAAALAKLPPGSAEQDYWRGVHLQHEGRLADVDALLEAWSTKHNGQNELYHQLARRQLIAKAAADLPANAEQIRIETGTRLDDRAEVVVQAQRFPTALDPALIDRRNVLRDACRRKANLEDVSDAAIEDIARDRTLIPGFDTVRRPFLQRLRYRTDIPGTLDLVLADLGDKDGSNRKFGALPLLHPFLSLAQLEELAQRMPEIRTQAAWVEAVLQRFIPPAWVDIVVDRIARSALLDRALAFVWTLAPTFNTLKANVLYHRLALDRANGVFDRARFIAYLELPRAAVWTSNARVRSFQPDHLVQPTENPSAALALGAIGEDERLVRDYLSRFLLEEEPEAYAHILDAVWLGKVAATARLLAGATGAEADRAAKMLRPAERDELASRIDIDIAPQNPHAFGANDDVTLAVDVKNVKTLEVKVFRIDALAYWLAKGQEIDVRIDLDGMVPSAAPHTLTFEHPPIRRHRVKIDLPECKAPGTYVVELVGNGRASRALLRKGMLRHLERTTAAGTAVTVTDADGAPLEDARLWLGGRELQPREGTIWIPFATDNAATEGMLVHGAVVQRANFKRPPEQPNLKANFHLERESLVANQNARLVCRPKLTITNAPASVGLVEDAKLELNLTMLDGTTTTRTQPVTLRDDEDVTLDFNVPDGAIGINVWLRGRFRVASRQETVDVANDMSAPINGIHASEQTAMLHLSGAGGRHVVSLLGKTGEPLAGRAVSFVLTHRDIKTGIQVTLETDVNGAIDLGAIQDVIPRIHATLPGTSQLVSWSTEPESSAPPDQWTAFEGDAIVFPRPATVRSLDDLALREVRRSGALLADANRHLTLTDRTIRIEGLAASEYNLSLRGKHTSLSVLPRAPVHVAPAQEPWTRIGTTIAVLSTVGPIVDRFVVDGDAVVLHVANATPETRVRLVATRYLPDPALYMRSQSSWPVPFTIRHQPGWAQYVSGRDIGEEARYVLERRTAARRPGMMLEKPSLLLQPWALRSTTTSRQEASPAASFGAPAPPPGAPMRPAMAAPAPMAGSPKYKMAKAAAEPTEEPGFVSVDFLAKGAIVLTNLKPDANGDVRVPLAELGDAQTLQAHVLEPTFLAPLEAEIALPAKPLRARDLRLRLALAPEKHFAEQRRIEGAPADTTLVVPDVRTGKIELVDTLARAHQILTTLMDDASDLTELAFVTQWHALDDFTRREKYSKYACHELNLYLWRKDPAFFAAVIKPSLADKREKALVDRFLLGEDLRSYLEPWAFGRLNTFERVLVGVAVTSLRAGIARLLGEQVDLIPPDPERDARLVTTLLGSAALEAGAAAETEAFDEEAPSMAMLEAQAPVAVGGPPRARAMGNTRAGAGGAGYGRMMADMAERNRSEIFFRGADRTQEWAEVQWWKRRIEELDASLIAPNRFWRDLAAHAAKGEQTPFLSPYLGDCANSFAEAMCALAFLELPFVATAPTTTLEETRLTIVPRSHALAASTSLIEIAARTTPSSVLIGQSYLRADDRWEWDGNERREKRVTGELIAGVVYRCQVVVTNPTSANEKLDVLMQIPKGAMPVASGFITRTVSVQLSPYGTQSLEYGFYFPLPGQFSHFPAHVTRAGELFVSASASELTVVAQPTTTDHGSWSHVSQHGTLDEVLAFLEKSNLGRIDLGRIAWRMQDRTAFTRITAALAARFTYDDKLWSYALMHRDVARAGEWLRHRDDFLRAGGIAPLGVDPTLRGWYQHLEYAPLINARAHQLGVERKILNDGLDAQYRKFLDLAAHHRALASDDLLVAAHYQLAMDRVEDALALLGRIHPGDITAHAQYAYLSAYVACFRGDLKEARRLATPGLVHPVDRWRKRFAALNQMLDEVAGVDAEPTLIDGDSRDQRIAEAAAKHPALDIAIRGSEITLTHANLGGCQLRFYKLDVELLFSRQPFVQGDIERFSFIEPGKVVEVTFDTAAHQTKVPIPEELRSANLVVEAVGPGIRKSVAHYAHDLGVQVAHAFGQLKVVRASTGQPLPATYVKVYSREQSGRVVFYKDGYTDLRGRLDYATLSTDDLDRAERFALLVVSDDAGATITEAPPPTR